MHAMRLGPVVGLAIGVALAPGGALGGPTRGPVTDPTQAAGAGARSDQVPVIILLRDQAEPFDLTALRARGPQRRRAEVIAGLRSVAERSQRSLLGALGRAASAGEASDIHPLWITNAVAARVAPGLVERLASRDDVAGVALDHALDAPAPATGAPTDGAADPEGRSVVCGVGAVRAPDAWAAGYTGDAVVVGVIDTGLCLSHPDITGRVWTNPGEIAGNGLDDDGNGFADDVHGWNFADDSNDLTDSQGHGSHVSGTVAGDGTEGMACGVAPGAHVMPLKFWNNLGGESSVWLAIQYGLENGADVLNGSLGWLHAWGPQRAAWRAVCENAFAAGVVVAFSAGGEGSGYGIDSVTTPGDVPDMITVGATDCDQNIAFFSSRGPVTWQDVDPYNDWPYPPGKRKPTVAAPGVNTLSHNLCDGYTYYSGVSMAVPHVSGAAALVLQANPDLDHYQVKQILEETAIDRGDSGPDNTYGAGFLDAWAAVRAALSAACIADFNADGEVDTLDVLAFLNAWNAGDPRADVNGDGAVDTLDVLTFLNLWNAGC